MLQKFMRPEGAPSGFTSLRKGYSPHTLSLSLLEAASARCGPQLYLAPGTLSTLGRVRTLHSACACRPAPELLLHVHRELHKRLFQDRTNEIDRCVLMIRSFSPLKQTSPARRSPRSNGVPLDRSSVRTATRLLVGHRLGRAAWRSVECAATRSGALPQAARDRRSGARLPDGSSERITRTTEL